MAVHNLRIQIDKSRIHFAFNTGESEIDLEFEPAQARAVARGMLRAAQALDPQRQLYAIATEKVITNKEGQKQWVPGGIEYLHANSSAQARMTFERARKDNQELRIVAIAPAIGIQDGKNEIVIQERA
jgi:hypothetical protein